MMKKIYYHSKFDGGWSIRRRLNIDEQRSTGKKSEHLWFAESEEEADHDVAILEKAAQEKTVQQ